MMHNDQKKVHWQGEVVSVQPRSNVWLYLADNRTHRKVGYNIFLKGRVCCDSELLENENICSQCDFAWRFLKNRQQSRD